MEEQKANNMSQVNFAEFKIATKAADAPCNRCSSTIRSREIHHIRSGKRGI